MKQEFLQRLFDLVRKTGDRLVVSDPQSAENAFVIMDVDSYERLRLPGMVGSKSVSKETVSAPEEVPLPPFFDEPPTQPSRDLKIGIAAEEAPAPPADWMTPGHPSSQSLFASGQAASEPKQEDARELEERFYLEPIE